MNSNAKLVHAFFPQNDFNAGSIAGCSRFAEGKHLLGLKSWLKVAVGDRINCGAGPGCCHCDLIASVRAKKRDLRTAIHHAVILVVAGQSPAVPCRDRNEFFAHDYVEISLHVLAAKIGVW